MIDLKAYPFNKLDPYFLAYNKINDETAYELLDLDPDQLVSQKRIDLIVKYYYIKARETGENLGFAKEMYGKHIQAFSDGTYKEEGNKDKNSLGKFFETFDQMIDDFKTEGFNPQRSLIPIGGDNELLDGSHRAACSIYFNYPVRVVKFPHLSVDYGFEFFRRRVLDEVYLDFIAKEYVNLKKEGYALFVWPKVGTDENMAYIEESLKQGGCDIIYQKKLAIDEVGLWNLIIHIYKNEYWVGYEGNNFKWTDQKRARCYEEGGFLGVFIINAPSVEGIKNKKALIRAFFGLGDASIHSMDSYEESVEILDLVLSENYDQVLYDHFLEIKDGQFTFKKYMKRRIRYFYRRGINLIKKIIGKPV